MTLDLQLFRDILLAIESAPIGQVVQGFTFEPPRDSKEVAEHVQLLIEDQNLVGQVRRDHKGFANDFAIWRLTMKGHDFIRTARNENLWSRVVNQAQERGDSISMTILNGLLSKAAEKYFGL